MAVKTIINGMTGAKNHWTRTVDKNGTVTITENRVGPTSNIVNWVKSNRVGSVSDPEDNPFGAKAFVVSATTVNVVVDDIAEGSISWSDDNGDSGSAESDAGGSDIESSEQIDFTLTEVPLECHPEFQNAFPCYGSGDSDGGSSDNGCEGSDDITDRKYLDLYINATDEDTAKEYYSHLDDAQKKFADKIAAGVTHYLAPQPTASRTVVSTDNPTDVGKNVGTKGDPEFEHLNTSGFEWKTPQASGKWDWLMAGDSVSWSSSKPDVYTRTQSWIARQKWDSELYS